MESAEIEFIDRDALTESISDNGTVTLAWQKPEALAVVLEQSDTPDFSKASIRYQGTDRATVLSGLPEGVHYFRVRDSESTTWSEPLPIKVEFFPRSRLYLLLSMGGVVVLATMVTIVSGYVTSRRREEAAP